ncbi:MAG: hypothetical protein RPS47_14380, partial [Colwellia sp.]
MSDYASEVGVLKIFDTEVGEHMLSNGKSFSIISSEDACMWVRRNPNKPLAYHATKLDDGNISFCINYYSFNGEYYVGCENFMEDHLIKFGILKKSTNSDCTIDEKISDIFKAESTLNSAIQQIEDEQVRSEAILSLMKLSANK